MYRGTYAQPGGSSRRRRRRTNLFLALVFLLELAVIGGFAAWLLLPEEPNRPESSQPGPEQPSVSAPVEPEPVPEDPAVTQARTQLLEEARQLMRGYYYEEALQLLDGAPDLANDETDALRQELADLQAQLVPYADGKFYHIFFHSLIVDTDKAFDGDYDAPGYDLYMTTVSEFEAMLPKLQEAGFVLVDIHDLVEFQDGVAVRKEILLPPGKKPLVLSVDDVNYYQYMADDGFASRLDLDENGQVKSVVDGVLTDNGDVVPILGRYVAEHPEFSWRGAKGILALTGYEGAFGYRITDLEDYDEATGQAMLQKTQAVAQALRETGWQIACHSYTHNQYWNNRTITMEQIQYDIGRWKRDIAPYVGETDIFISPFGVSFARDDARMAFLREQGFSIYCHVDSTMPTKWDGSWFIQGRINLDGLTMKRYPERISQYFFDPSEILDPARPQ